MIFVKSLRRDLGNLAGIVFATLFTIMVTTTLIRLLGRAAGGRVDTASVLPLIAFTAIHLLPVLLVLTLYVTVLMAITRAYRDSEMVIWFASGRSLASWIRPVLGFAAPFIALVAVIALFVAPWANRQSAEYMQRFEQREDVSMIAPGQFRESASATRVFFVESISDDQTSVRNVFVTQTRGTELNIVVSAGGRIETMPDGNRFLVLEKGRRYDGEPSAAAFRVMEFERYGLRLDPKSTSVTSDSTKIKPTLELIRDPVSRNLGELAWRISLPVSALLLALLAIPLATFNPRVGRSINLIVALLIYAIYSNLNSLMQAWVGQKRVDFAIGVWVVHSVVVGLVAFMFWRRLTLPRVRMPRLPFGLRREKAAS
jgi:lipopolysaccharide export system permease protein